MARIQLNFLPTFVAVAKLENLRAAADSLHLTHSAVSQQIGELENRLGFPLFDRRGRRVHLNAAGQALLRHAAPALAQVDDGVLAAAAAAAGGAAQGLRVTMLPSFAQRWFLPRIGSWREQHPDIPLEIDASVNIDRPAARRLPRRHPHRAGAVARPGAGAPLRDADAVHRGRGAAHRRRLNTGQPADMAREPLLGDAEVWERWFAVAGVRTRVTPVASFNDVGLMLQAAEQGLGLAVVRELLAADALHDGRLARLFDVSVLLEGVRAYSLVYPPALRDWPPLIALRDWLRHEFDCSLAMLRENAISER